MSNAGGFKSLNRYYDMLAGNTTFVDSSFESIQTVTVGAGGQTSIDFTSIPSTYKHLQIRLIARSNHTDQDGFKIQLNGTTASNYSYHYVGGNGSVTYAGAASSTSFMQGTSFTGSNAGSSIFGVGVIDILDYTNTDKNKTVRSLGGFDSNGAGVVEMWSGGYYLTPAVTSIKLFSFNAATFQQYSSFALYGIKG
jgi:hypothetical protein